MYIENLRHSYHRYEKKDLIPDLEDKEVNFESGKSFKINNVVTLNATTLGSAVVTSSLTTVGTITTGVWEGTAIAADKGGTNQTSWTAGDLLYASGANTLSRLALGNAGDQLKVNALGTQVAWEAGASGASVGLAMAFAIVF